MQTEELKGFIRLLIEFKKDFTLVTTGYTTEIHFKDQKFVFSNSLPDWKVFDCYNRIKKDVEQSQIHIDTIPKIDISYYKINSFLKKPCAELPDHLVCLDLNSAYLSVLLNYGIISKDTFMYVQKSGKLARLKSVGMLATLKTIETYKEGKLSGKPESKFDPHKRNIFFLACHEVGKLMEEIATMYKDEFFFYWTDGIYFDGNANLNRAKHIIQSKGFQCKEEHLRDVTFSSDPLAEVIRISGIKDEKRKEYTIPIEEEENTKNLRKFLNSLNASQLKKFNQL